MRGAGITHAANGANKWNLGVRQMIDSTRIVDVIALQEAGPGSVIMGDWNRRASELSTELRGRHTVYSSREHTYPVAPIREQRNVHYDYAVVPSVSDENLRVDIQGTVRLSDIDISDHYPVAFGLNTPDDSEPPRPPSQSRNPPLKKSRVLRNARSTKAPYPSGSSSSGGSSRLSLRGVERSNVGQQRFVPDPVQESPGNFLLVHQMTYTFVGLENGVDNASAVLHPEYDGPAQLWSAVDMRDGTWVLRNAATGQVLSTAGTAGGDEELVGRDYDPSDGAQRWFLQDAATEALDVDEIVRHDDGTAQWALSALDGSAENTELTTAFYNHDDHERFTTIPAEGIGDGSCYYLVHNGKYVNSSTSQSEPSEGDTVRLNTFLPNHDSFAWCMDIADRYLCSVLLTQYSPGGEPPNLTFSGVNGAKLTLTKDSSTAETWLWKEAPE
ncbi:RICIN domain-containing protein [Streptomyces sp. CB02400]|uniref:RICIN domain-containing protein n=1 Tax=Streptomyces sp. CB02400 TaxID=1703944 RepID=UPI0011610B0C|nr:RICIN domain-containing protein [Streptomyces sp. CB02400]